MSRLDSFIRRLEAQRACLNHAAALVAARPGPVMEVGLGNGRTYDHLRQLFPARTIYVVERDLNPHPLARPPEDLLLLGDLAQVLPTALARMGEPAVLVHADIGTGDAAVNAATAAKLAQHVPAVIAADGILLCDQRIDAAWALPLPLPAGVEPGRYHLYQAKPRLPGEA